MKKIILMTLLLLPSFIFSQQYFVSNSGDDTLNDGLSLAAPFLTIQKAASILLPGDTCLIRGGLYRETIRPVNSGQQGMPITFTSYNGESVTVTGADLATGAWSVYSGSIWQLSTSENFNQLFVNGQMMNEARWPNTPVDDLLHMVTATARTGTNAAALADPALPAGSWNGAYVWIQPGDGWGSYTRQISGYAAGIGFSFSQAIGTGDLNYEPRSGNPYYIFGALSGLDSPGEWFLDTSADILYLWTLDSQPPATHIVEYKKRNYAFDLAERSYVNIFGLNIFSAAISMPEAHHCIVDTCSAKYVDHYTQAAGFAVPGGETNSMGGSYNEWKNSVITYSAGCGIYVTGMHNKVTNCIIHDTGYMGSNHGAVMTEGADGAQTFGHIISGNTIYNTGRFGIFHPTTRDLKITYNDISYPGLLSKDCGPIYAYGLDVQYTEIAYNWVHDNYTTYGAGVYLDNGSNRHLVHHNVAWNCAGTGIVLNTPSEYNLVYNNTIINCSKSFDYYGNAAQGLGNIESQLGSKVINNRTFNSSVFAHDPPAENHHNGNYPLDANFVPSFGSGAIDAGLIIPGITDNYTGAAPDIGAYEYGGTYWRAGYSTLVPTATPGGPAFTFTNTPTMTPTPTITMTIPYIPGYMIDDADDCNSTNSYGGSWLTYDDSGNGGVSTVWPGNPFTVGAPGYGGAGCGIRITGTVRSALGGYTYPSISAGAELVTGRDYSTCLGVRFKLKGDSRYYQIKLHADASINTGYNDYKYTIFAGDTWQYYILPFTLFTQYPGWGIVVDKGAVLSKVKQIVITTAAYPPQGTQYNVDVTMDELEVYGCGLATPTVTPTATTIIPAGMIDSCDDLGNMNDWGGYWFTYDDSAQVPPGVSVAWPPGTSFTMTAPGFDSTGYAARLTGTVEYLTGGYAYPMIGMTTTLPGIYDMTSCTGLRFWYKNDSKPYYVKMQCHSSIPTGYNYYRYTLPAAPSWTLISIPFSSFTQASGWGLTVTSSTFFTKITGVQFQTDSFPPQGAQWNVDLSVDNLEIYGCPGVPTVTLTPVASSTPTQTLTLTITTTEESPSFTETQTPSLTETLTLTVTITNTQTPVPEETATATATQTNTPQAEEGIPYPNPVNPDFNDLYIGAVISADAYEVSVKIYSGAFRMIRKVDCGALSAGRQPVKVGRNYLSGLANGIYYCVVESSLNNGKTERARPVEVIILR